MKYLVISTVFPSGQSYGKIQVMSGLLHFLLENPANEVTWLHVAPDCVDPKLPRLCYHHVPCRLGVEALWRGLTQACLLRRRSLQECLVYSSSTASRLAQVVQAAAPDLVIYDTIRMEQYRDTIGYAFPSIVYLDDLFSLRYKRVLSSLARYDACLVNPLGTFRRFVPSLLHPLFNHRCILSCLLRLECGLVLNSERRAIRRNHQAHLISERETRLARRLYGCTSPRTQKLYSPGLQSRPASEDGGYFLMLGDLTLPHNAVALAEMLQALRHAAPMHVLPIHVVGRGIPEQLLQEIKACPQVQYLGYVEDIVSELTHARALLAPLAFGSGIKIKTLEAFAFGVPVIGTRHAVEGLSVTKGVHYLHADNAEDCLPLMDQLAKPEERRRLSQAALQWYEDNATPGLVRHEYEVLFSLKGTLLPSQGNPA